MEKKRISSLRAVTAWLSFFLFLLWAAAMVCTTIVSAQYLYQLFYHDNKDFASTVAHYSRLDTAMEDAKGRPGFVEYRIFEALDRGSRSYYSSAIRRTEDDINLLWNDSSIRFQTAVAVYDGQGSLLGNSGDFMYFYWSPEDVWLAQSDHARSFAYIDLTGQNREGSPYWKLCAWGRSSAYRFDLDTLRITGIMDGFELKPVKMDYISRNEIHQALDKRGYDGEYSTQELLRDGYMDWTPMFDYTDTVAEGTELVTVYAETPTIHLYDSGDGFRYDGTECPSLLSLLLERKPDFAELTYAPAIGASRYGLAQTVQFDIHYIYDDAWEYSEADPIPDLHYVIMTAVRSTPLLSAMSALRYVYVVTLLFAAGLVLLLRRILQRNLIRPLREVNIGFSGGWVHLPTQGNQAPGWQEPHQLYQHYNTIQDQLRSDKNEVTRLSTALSYAKRAEEERRRMTSNIAHELKTPLAIIHSYSEGLKAHIAEEKREQYLDTILSESEHMDAMVLEMLDLSRLEAGKVKLARDEFSLSQLTQSLFDKLALLAQDKELQIVFDFDGECMVSADEGRIGQVITNLAANAIKYTPRGGNVRVRTSIARQQIQFALENDSPPLDTEALNKVWEAFYRTDHARTDTGTGLGLAIAKSIVELHGGKCYARNTKTGVEFGFTLPT